MKKITQLIYAALAVCFTLLPLSACKTDDKVKTVKVNEVTHSVFYAPLYLADSLGYFTEEKIEIELTNGGGADNVMASVLSSDTTTSTSVCGVPLTEERVMVLVAMA